MKRTFLRGHILSTAGDDFSLMIDPYSVNDVLPGHVLNTIHVNLAEIMAANIQPTTHGQTDVDADPSDQRSDMKITMNLPKKISLFFDCRYKFDLICMCIMTSALKKQCSDISCLLETWSVRIGVMGLGGWVAR